MADYRDKAPWLRNLHCANTDLVEAYRSCDDAAKQIRVNRALFAIKRLVSEQSCG